MDRNAYAFAAGLFVVILGLGLLVTARWISKPAVEQVPYRVVSTTSVAGLSPYSRVYYRGVEVGQVAAIVFAGDGSRDIFIDILLGPRVPVTTTTYGVLKSQGLTGLSQIELLDDGPLDAPPLPTSTAQPGRIAMRPSLLESFQTVGQGIAEQIQQLTGNVNRLLTPETADRIGRTLANLEHISRRVDEALAASRPALDRLAPLLDQGNATLAGADRTLAALRETLSLLQQRLHDAEAVAAHADAAVAGIGARVTTTTLPELEATLAALTEAAGRFQQLSTTLERNPPALLFGSPPPPPGPGESGYRGD